MRSEQKVLREATQRDKPVGAGYSRVESFNKSLASSLSANITVCLNSIRSTKALIDDYKKVFQTVTGESSQEPQHMRDAFKKGSESLDNFISILSMVEDLVIQLDVSKFES